MRVRNISKFSCGVYKFVSPLIVEALKKFGIENYIVQQAKSVVAIDKKGLFGKDSAENILDNFHFYCSSGDEAQLFDFITNYASLSQEGRGSLFVEPAILIEKDERENNFDELDFTLADVETNLFGIYAIIQRGWGNTLAKTAIESGSCVPSVFYGVGGGIRDRMGLIRITIPAEKEMVNVVVAEHDVMGMMDLLINAGRLDRPGMGFIFTYPVTRAVMDTKSFYGANRSAASIGQIINAIDAMQGGAEWRRRTLNLFKIPERKYLKDLENIMLICDDTQAKDMLEVSMSAGATGATISTCRETLFSSEKRSAIKKTIEISDMVIGKNQKGAILSALFKAGFFSDKINGKVIVKKSGIAFSYTDNKKK